MDIWGGFGSTLIAGLVSAMLYGVTTLQTYVYYMHYYSEDGSTTKFIVAAIWILDTLHVSFMCHMLYYYLITKYGDVMSLQYIAWSFPASALVTSFVLAIVQCFFIHKIYYLCSPQLRWLVTAPIILLVLARIGFGTATVVVMLINDAVSFASRTRFYTTTPAMSAIAVAEILVTVSLCVLLYERSSCSVVARTKRLLNTLIIYAINRCLLTLFVVIAEVTVNADDRIAWTMGLDFIVGKLYANSLLASLNTRQHLRSQGYGSKSDLGMNAIQFANLPKLSGDIESLKDGVIGTSTIPPLDKTTTLQREEVV